MKGSYNDGCHFHSPYVLHGLKSQSEYQFSLNFKIESVDWLAHYAELGRTTQPAAGSKSSWICIKRANTDQGYKNDCPTSL